MQDGFRGGEMRRLLVAALVLFLFVLAPHDKAQADEFTPAELVLMKLFGTDPITPDMFASGFLARISMDQVLSVFAKTRAMVGPPVSIEQNGGGYLVHTATYQIPVDIGLDGSGRIAALLLHPAVENFATAEDVLAAIGGLPGRVAYLVTRNDQTLYARGQTLPLAVSSAFKLGVLAALADEIAAGKLKWDQVVRLDAGDISLTPGMLQDMPAGSPLTVHTLAALMTAQSDNTATDMLIDLIGRDRVENRLGADFVLKTTEFYKLKADPALRLRFSTAKAAGKLGIAAEMSKLPLPDPGDVTGPLDPGIEWYLSSSALCRLTDAVSGLDVFQINPGAADKADWAKIAFKSGSEVGVASLTTRLVDRAGNRYCVSLTVNDSKPLDEQRVTSLYGSLIAELARK